MDLVWEPEARIRVEIQRDEVVLSANREGLRTLAAHLLTLARETPGSHIHYDEWNGLEEGSAELVVERREEE